jgi:hypothetical protein
MLSGSSPASEREGIAKNINRCIFCHLQITHIINPGMNESIIKVIM